MSNKRIKMERLERRRERLWITGVGLFLCLVFLTGMATMDAVSALG